MSDRIESMEVRAENEYRISRVSRIDHTGSRTVALDEIRLSDDTHVQGLHRQQGRQPAGAEEVGVTQWSRLSVDVRCGLCGETVPTGKPVKVLQVGGVKRPKFRGECCEGQAPANVPMRTEPRPSNLKQSGFTPSRDVMQSALDKFEFDFKMAQAGRDPGEEG